MPRDNKGKNSGSESDYQSDALGYDFEMQSNPTSEREIKYI